LQFRFEKKNAEIKIIESRIRKNLIGGKNSSTRIFSGILIVIN